MAESLKHSLTIGLLWHTIASENFGAVALTLSQMKIIAEAGRRRNVQVRFIILSPVEEKSGLAEDFEIIHRAEFSRRAFMEGRFEAVTLLKQCDIIFNIGAGDSFSDIYGNKRLAMQVIANILARLYRKPLVVSPQTIGPFKSFLGKQLGKIGLSVATRIYARDNLSMQYLLQAKFQNKSEEVIDVAFALPFERPSRDSNTSMRIGINVSGLLYNKGYSGRNEFELTVDYPALIEEVCRYFLVQPDIEVYLVHHVFADIPQVHPENDLHVNMQLQKRYPKLRIAPIFRTPSEAKSFISGMDFFTGARMHACIAAFSSGVPVLPMAYSRKFNGLFGSLNYPHILDCLTLDTSSAMQKLIQAFENREQLANEIEVGNKIAHIKLETYTEQVSSLLPI
ncbi:MAG: polysaccharide pyruvyl transferase family protein [Betaproteobacteria bacterium]|nr:polysaccharide pyruvyl transferase family protein [Betaproteobacteria bacterium]